MLRLALLISLYLCAVEGATLFSIPPGLNPTAYPTSGGKSPFNGPAVRRYENFSLAAGATVNEIVWWGMEETNFLLFEISIFTGHDLSAPIWSAESMFTRREDSYPPQRMPLHRYTATLGNPFIAQNGDTYWISIFHKTGGMMGWGWLEADSFGDGSRKSDFVQGSGWNAPRYDSSNLAFELNEVPEPSYYALVALCLIAGAWLHHHRTHLHRALTSRMKPLPHRDRLV